MSEDTEQQKEILEFWLGSKPHSPSSLEPFQKIWYTGGSEIDSDIRDRFGEIHGRSASETTLHWAESARGSLALVIVLDQFSRNLYRDSPKAYAQDALARAVAKRAIKQGFDQSMSVPERVFLLHPFHHSESLSDQLEGCRLLHELANENHEEWQVLIASSISWFEGHCDIVKRFSRFPHRNEVLGRQSSEDEIVYLVGKK